MTAIYTEHFGLREEPFSLAPDPRYLYASEQHREALAHLLYGVRGEGGFVLLTGEVGTGKTTVFRTILEMVPEWTRIAFVLHPRLSAFELLATVCDEFGIQYPTGTTSVKVLVERINGFLLAEAEAGNHAVLVIDEAQNLDTDVLEQLRLLTNLETSRRKLLQIILIGQPELREKLDRPEMRQLSQRITARFHLEPLRRRDVGPYILHRLRVAGGNGSIFHPRAIRRIAGLSQGVPRIINLLCDRALLGSFAGGKAMVTADIVTRAQVEIEGKRGRKRFAAARAAVPAAALLAAAAALLLLGPRTPFREIPPVPPAEQADTSPPPAAARPAVPATSPAAEAGGDGTARDLQWLFSHAGAGTWGSAGRTLSALWGTEALPSGDGLCDAARKRGLRCLSGSGGVEDLVRLNRPAILKMMTFEGEDFFAVLTELEGRRANLRFDGGEGLVNLRWFGEYTLLWKPPPGYSGLLHAGGRGPVVAWLRERLGAGDGRSAGGDDTYGPALVEQVRAFQRSRGIAVDGIVGPITVIHLNTASGEDVPLLRRKGEG